MQEITEFGICVLRVFMQNYVLVLQIEKKLVGFRTGKIEAHCLQTPAWQILCLSSLDMLETLTEKPVLIFLHFLNKVFKNLIFGEVSRTSPGISHAWRYLLRNFFFLN